MIRFILAIACIFCFYADARNETLHACELLLKCFEEADLELLQCQKLLMFDFVSSNVIISNNEIPINNETAEEATVTPQPDDCMAPIREKMQQKKALVEQRTQAFATCLNQRMERGPEDVDPRKYRYCNTAISRYTARTTIATSPEFILSTTPAIESSTIRSTTRHTTTKSPTHPTTTKSKSTSTNLTHPSSSIRPSAIHITPPTLRSTQVKTSRSPLGLVRPRRAAVGPSLELENEQNENQAFTAAPNGTTEIIRPPALWRGEKKNSTGSSVAAVTVSSVKRTEKPEDPFEQRSTTIRQKHTTQEPLPQKAVLAENEAGKIGAVAKFSLNGLISAQNKEVETSNEKATTVPSKPQAESLAEKSEEASPISELDRNQNKTQKDIHKTTTENPNASLASATIIAIFPPSAGPPATPREGSAGPPGSPQPSENTPGSTQSNTRAPQSLSPTIKPDQSPSFPNIVNSSISESFNSTSIVSIVVQHDQGPKSDQDLAQQQWPLSQSSIDSSPQQIPSRLSPVSVVELGANSNLAPNSNSSSNSNLAPNSNIPTDQSNTGVESSIPKIEKKPRSQVEALRESRRLVSEFKTCMARARVKREECKPLVNCCPDATKCHLRYELSELHDQIHRLELEIAEGRLACLEKKKENESLVDPIDQIDEEDLVSDESIVSQQVF